MTRNRQIAILLPALAVWAVLAQSGQALDKVEFKVPGADKDLVSALRDASGLLGKGNVKKRAAQDLFADARAEYSRLVEALYAAGYYAPVVHVLVNGREAAEISPFDTPTQIDSLVVTVTPGPQFRFSTLALDPLAPRTVLPGDFVPGAVAAAETVQLAVTSAIDRWRALGHAKAAVASQDVVADHADATLAVGVGLDPGPVLRFGEVTVTGADRMRVERVLAIAGIPAGVTYSPDIIDRATERLRRSGVFSSVTLLEADRVTKPDLLGVNIAVAEARLHRYEVGAELASLDGAKLSALWLHRNLFGGGERLTFSGEVANIGAQSSGLDYSLGVTLDRPATFDPDTNASLSLKIAHEDETDYVADTFDAGLTLNHWFNKRLTGRAGLAYAFAQGQDAAGDFLFQSLEAPLGATWDNRNSTTDATKGVYLDAGVKPFLGFGQTDDGLRLTFDARAYKSVAVGNGLTFAARLQGGTVLFADPLNTPRDDLFYSGGGGTVRGLPYQSLGATVVSGGVAVPIGGTDFIGSSVEARLKINDSWGVVGFLDAGLVDIGGFSPSDTNWQAGAGLGVRYETGFGPIRFDVAVPVHGDTGDGVQLYVGLGQSF